MAEYIERSVAIAKLTALEVTEPNATMADAKRVLADTPGADVAPVVHGRWDENWNCVNCGRHAPFWFMSFCCYKSKYCPNCGAKMDIKDGGDNDAAD